MTGDQHTNGQPDTRNEKPQEWKETTQAPNRMINDLVLSPFITGIVQGFFSVAMQRRRERRQAREAAAKFDPDKDPNNNKNDVSTGTRTDKMDISNKLRDSLLAAKLEVKDTLKP